MGRGISLSFSLRNILEEKRQPRAFDVIHRVAPHTFIRHQIFGRTLWIPSIHFPTLRLCTFHLLLSLPAAAFAPSFIRHRRPPSLFELRETVKIVPFGKWSSRPVFSADGGAVYETVAGHTGPGNMEMLIDAYNACSPRDRWANICKITRNDNPLSTVIWTERRRPVEIHFYRFLPFPR